VKVNVGMEMQFYEYDSQIDLLPRWIAMCIAAILASFGIIAQFLGMKRKTAHEGLR